MKLLPKRWFTVYIRRLLKEDRRNYMYTVVSNGTNKPYSRVVIVVRYIFMAIKSLITQYA